MRLLYALALALALGTWGIAASGAGAAAPSRSAATGVRASTPEVSWTPAEPRQGTLFTITVKTPAPLASAPTGTFAGERLHFHAAADGSWWALAALPVDAEGGQTLRVRAGVGAEEAERVHEVTPAPGRYAMERLTVAPGYAAPPDAATAARIERESARAMEVARAAHDTPRLWSADGLVRPRPSRITSGFGNGRQFNGQVQSRHMGTDFAGAVGEPVLAAAAGVVRIAEQFHLGGRVVYLDHGGGLSSAYLHLSAQSVAVGDTVAAGQRIGSVGATGRVTGPHLHWIVRYGGVTVDPMSLLELSLPR